MRRFSSYGPINEKLNYYAPRKKLIEKGYTQLVAKIPKKGVIILRSGRPGSVGKHG